jgi:hypothetical protein
MNVFKNYTKLFVMLACAISLICCIGVSKILAMESNVEIPAIATKNDTEQNSIPSAQLELDTITDNILTELNTSFIKNNKIDAMGTSLALMMMLGYSCIGCIPPHVATTSSFVHASGAMLNQHEKNKVYTELVENLNELKRFTQQILVEKSSSQYSEKILDVTKALEKNLRVEMKSNRRTFFLKIMVAIPFIIGYFMFSEINAASKLYPESFSEITNMMKMQNSNKDAKLSDEQIIQAKVGAVAGVIVEAILRVGYGFSKDGNYYMLPWLSGAILEMINLHYIRCSNRDYCKTALEKINEIKKILADGKANATV